MDLTKIRNIGISAHIDSGKTTLSERILYYAGRIHKIEEVKGGGSGATMDHMELEKERGITITSAATSLKWQWNGDYHINLIDTPGHVDFTVEVERSLRVLDGAVMVLCAVGGVQAQSHTIDRQMRRYGVPRLAFINKMDRMGANHIRVVEQLHSKLHCQAVLMQLPIGKEVYLEGVVDLLRQEAIYFDGDNGETRRKGPVPENMVEEVKAARQHMLEAVSMFSDDLMELLLGEQEVPIDLVEKVVRQATLSLQMTPVFVGSAYKNKGVQELLDAVCKYLPSPLDVPCKALAHNDPNTEFPLSPDPTKPAVGMAFKIVEDAYGTLTFMRIYQGRIAKGETHYNQRNGRKERYSKIVRMHADEREDIDSAEAGDIVAVLGLDCATGDTYCSQYPYCTLQSMFVAEPVIKMAINPVKRDGADKLSKALHRFRREDPTLKVTTDEETAETIIAGMGELHLEIYVERIRREYGVEVEVGEPPKVNYREAPTQACEFNTKHKKQTGGSGQYAHIVGNMEPLPEDTPEAFVFEEKIVGGKIPKNFIPAIEKGFREMVDKGPIAGFPVVGLKVHINDGSYHDVDSSEMAFRNCAKTCMRDNFPRTKPVLLEPIMKIEIECPSDAQGSVVGNLTSRRGMVVATEVEGASCRIEAEIPLAETFGYSTDLRSMTQGQGVFSMEFAKYRRMPGGLEKEVIAARKEMALAGAN